MFRFTIRELVLLTLVVAMGVGWWTQSRIRENALREAGRDARNRADKLNERVKLAEITANNAHNEAQYWRMIADRLKAKETANHAAPPAEN